MSKLENKAVEVMDKAMDGVDKLTVMLGEVAERYGPEVVDAALNVARVSAGAALVYAAVGVGLIYSLFRIGIPLTYKYRASLSKKNRSEEEFWFPVIVIWIPVLFITAGVSLGALRMLQIFNVWNWVGLIEPKLWIAQKVLGW